MCVADATGGWSTHAKGWRFPSQGKGFAGTSEQLAGAAGATRGGCPGPPWHAQRCACVCSRPSRVLVVQRSAVENRRGEWRPRRWAAGEFDSRDGGGYEVISDIPSSIGEMEMVGLGLAGGYKVHFLVQPAATPLAGSFPRVCSCHLRPAGAPAKDAHPATNAPRLSRLPQASLTHWRPMTSSATLFKQLLTSTTNTRTSVTLSSDIERSQAARIIPPKIQCLAGSDQWTLNITLAFGSPSTLLINHLSSRTLMRPASYLLPTDDGHAVHPPRITMAGSGLGRASMAPRCLL